MTYIIGIISFFILLTIFYYVAPFLKLIDEPNSRKRHKGNIPLIGGLIIYLNLFIFMFYFEIGDNMRTVLLTSIILLILGALDDVIELGIIFRLIAQFACCLIVIGSGLLITHIGDYMMMPKLEIGIFSIIFTIFCVIGLTNSFNFIDGVDGLCASLALISVVFILIISLLDKSYIYLIEFEYLILFSIILILFIFFNINNRFKIFLGDAGSMFLGFFISWLLIMTSQGYETSSGIKEIIHPVLALWCVTLPVFDIFSVIIKRILINKNPFKPDRRHIHHILLQLGFDNTQTLFLILILSVVLNCFGLLIYYISGPLPALVSFILLLITYVIFMLQLSRKANIK